jgi:hypothetical protein
VIIVDQKSEEIANAVLILALPLPFLMLGLSLIIDGDYFLSGIITFVICFSSSIIYLLYPKS